MYTKSRSTIAFLAFTAAAMLAGVAQAQTTYTCVVGISPSASNNCSGAVTIGSISGNQRVATIDLNHTVNWASLSVLTQVCSPSGWTINIGDSPTNNGGGGDGASTNHDAETQILDRVPSVFPSDYLASPRPLCQFPAISTGCSVQEWFLYSDGTSLSFDPEISFGGNEGFCSNSALFDFPFYRQSDGEDPNQTWADKLFVGLNRTVGTATRSGTGVQRACFVLSTGIPSQSQVRSLCGF
ncbi:MAG TPA: hypothetical protein VGG03_19125 [Thermoanaerobaculia bacterium]|jgi:hypothetical protein